MGRRFESCQGTLIFKGLEEWVRDGRGNVRNMSAIDRPAGVAVTAGFDHHALVALGFRELPRNPDGAVGGEAMMGTLKAALPRLRPFDPAFCDFRRAND